MKICSIEDCGRRFQAKGYCKKHYLHYWRFGTPIPHIEQHGMKATRLYNIWCAVKQRCNYEKSARYDNYGKRGIKVCPQWQNNFLVFQNWALANGYKDTLSIDRMDNDGDYEPGNCRWATHKEQANNKTNNRFITMGRVTQTLAQWAAELGINYFTLKTRLRRGWPPEKAMLTPARRSR